jgi:hypothetical protein
MMRTMTAEGNLGAMLRRAVLLLAAGVVVVSMMAATASPASALRHRGSGNFLCTDPSSGEFATVNGAGRNSLEDQGFTCVKAGKRR